MSNTISSGVPGVDVLRLSNGLTSVLLTVLGLSGSRLAAWESEKRLVMWLLEHDQAHLGGGTVGFSLTELPWRSKSFGAQRDFLLRAAECAGEELGWDSLDYTPNRELLLPALEQWNELLAALEPEHIDFAKVSRWTPDGGLTDEEWRQYPLFARWGMEKNELASFPQCEKHSVLLTVFGCHACNDSPH